MSGPEDLQRTSAGGLPVLLCLALALAAACRSHDRLRIGAAGDHAEGKRGRGGSNEATLHGNSLKGGSMVAAGVQYRRPGSDAGGGEGHWGIPPTRVSLAGIRETTNVVRLPGHGWEMSCRT